MDRVTNQVEKHLL